MSTDTLIILGIAGVMVLVLVLPFYLRQRRLERATDRAAEVAERYGLSEPVSLHPVVRRRHVSVPVTVLSPVPRNTCWESVTGRRSR